MVCLTVFRTERYYFTHTYIYITLGIEKEYIY